MRTSKTIHIDLLIATGGVAILVFLRFVVRGSWRRDREACEKAVQTATTCSYWSVNSTYEGQLL